MRGPDPRIHGVGQGTGRWLDRRVKPGAVRFSDPGSKTEGAAQPLIVMRGLDPRIHKIGHSTGRWLDRRVKPGDDNLGGATPLVAQLVTIIASKPDSRGSSPAMPIVAGATPLVAQLLTIIASKPDSRGSSPGMTLLVERHRSSGNL